jgi:hypothetical protein
VRSLVRLIAVGLWWGCGPAPVPLTGTLPGGHHALPVAVDDPAGLVRAIAPGGPGDLGTHGEGPIIVPGRPTAAVVTWTGGACDVRATITVRATNDRLEIGVATQATFGCESVGVFRRVTLDFAEPIGNRELVIVEVASPS